MASRQMLLKMVADVTGAQRGIKETTADLKKLGGYTAESVVKIKTEAAQAKLEKLQAQMKRLGEQKQTPDVKIRTARVLAQIEKVQRELDQVGAHAARAGTEAGAGIERAGLATERVTGRLREHRKEFLRYAKAAVGLTAAYAAVTDARGAVESTDELAKATLLLSRNFGLSVEAASKWAAVARSRDVEPTALHMGFTRLSAAVEKAAHGSEGARASFRQLGITQADLQRGQHDFPFLLERVTKSFSNLHGGTQRAALAQQLFGRGARGLLPLLRQGELGFAAQSKLAEKYGATLKGSTLEEVEKLVKAQREAKFATSGLQVAFGTGLAPVLTRATQRTSKFILEMREGTGAGGRFARAMRQIISPLRSIVNFLVRHPHVIQAAIAAWAAYKLAAVAALIATRARLVGMFFGLKPRAAAAGEASGRAFGLAFALFAGYELTQLLQPQIQALAAAGANAITGIDPKKTAADRNRTASSERAAAEKQAAAGQPGIWIDANGKQHTIQPKRVPTQVIGTNRTFLARPPGRGRRGADTSGDTGGTADLTNATTVRARALRLNYNKARKDYAEAVRKYGANSSAAIRAAVDVVDTRAAIGADARAQAKRHKAENDAAAKRRRAEERHQAQLRRPATSATRDALAAAKRAQRYQEIVNKYGEDSPQAAKFQARTDVSDARAEVKTDRGLFADAVRRFGAASDRAVKAHTRLIEAQTKLSKASGELKDALHKSAQACGAALIPRATDIAVNAAAGRTVNPAAGWGGQHLGHRGWRDVYVDKLVMPETAAPIGDPRYDAVKLHRGLRSIGSALPA